ncbi:MAG: SDR family NAD(P)-dependent oxidoreductase, partial [Lutisporaceae bacterium]
YKIHPALLDCAVILTKEFLEGEFYLPLSYENLRVYGNMPDRFYSHMSIKRREGDSRETISFSLSLADESGNVFMEIEDYTVKKVNATEYNAMKSNIDDADYFEIGWIRKPIVKANREIKGKTALVIGNGKGISSEIVKSLEENNLKVYLAEEGYIELLSKLDTEPSYIIHLLTADDTENPASTQELNDAMQLGVYSLYNLVRALVSQKLVNTKLILISKFANNVTGDEEKIQPHNAAFLGLGKVIEKEYPGIMCKCIDIDNEMTTEDIVTEIESDDASQYVSYRKSTRYIEEFRKMDLQKQAVANTEIHSEGVYVITGGTGGIGLEFAQYLATRNKTNICLISRSGFPKRDEWNSILNKNEDYKLCKKINKMKEIEEQGSVVLCYSGDIVDMTSMQLIFSELRERFGNINGVIHGAGVAGDGFIIRRDKALFKQVIAPKTLGTWILDKLTENDKLDFFVMHSSIASILGPPGQGDYTAANSYLDAFAYYMMKKGKRALTINWPSWRDTGMAVDYGAINEQSLFMPISTDLALIKFEKLLGTQALRSIPAKLNYVALNSLKNELLIALSDEVRHKLGQVYSVNERQNRVEDNELSNVKIILKGKVEQEYTETESELAKIWFNVLGITEVDIFDNFNDLGGDSILATRLLKEMQKKYDDKVNISDVFTYSTINKMADYIDKKANKKKIIEKIDERKIEEDLDLDELINQIANGNISAEEAEKLISLE